MAEEETSGVVACVYDAICIHIPCCNWFHQAIKSILQCLGFSDSITSSQVLEKCSTTDPLIMDPAVVGSDAHKEDDGSYKPVITSAPDSRGSEAPPAGSSSSSSSSSSDGEEQEADPQPPSTDPPSDQSTDPSVLATGRSRMPPRPPVSSGRGGQTN